MSTILPTPLTCSDRCGSKICVPSNVSSRDSKRWEKQRLRRVPGPVSYEPRRGDGSGLSCALGPLLLTRNLQCRIRPIHPTRSAMPILANEMRHSGMLKHTTTDTASAGQVAWQPARHDPHYILARARVVTSTAEAFGTVAAAADQYWTQYIFRSAGDSLGMGWHGWVGAGNSKR